MDSPMKMPGGFLTGEDGQRVGGYIPLSLLMLGNGVKRFTAPHGSQLNNLEPGILQPHGLRGCAIRF